MPQSFWQFTSDRRLRKQLLRRGALWTLIVAVILGLGSYFLDREVRRIALALARHSFQKDVTTRLWVTQRGGIYVPLDEKTPANPYLKNLTNREITTTTGKVFTLVNPAYMTRMLHELGRREYGLQGHITSLKPIRPENAADAWEQKALQYFETGPREYWEELTLAGRPHLRFMGALMTVEDCLRCHAVQGYKVGDVRGGISVTVPLEQGSGLIGSMGKWGAALGGGIIWGIGIGVILLAGRWNQRQINERKQAEEKLSKNESRLKSIFSAMTEGFSIQEVVCDETGRPCDLRFIEANPAFEIQTGLKNTDTLGHTLLELFPQAEPYWIERYGKVGLTGEPIRFEANFGPLGKYYQVSAFQTEPGRFGTLFTDINERKQAEAEKLKLQAQLQQSQKMESLGVLAGGVAHDMNNVLGAILGLASAHVGKQSYGSPLRQALDTICKATERGGKMVKSLLSFARQSPVENNKLDMNAILREQVALLERTTLAKVRLHLDMETELRPIMGDASALTHAFMNLCVNAVDAMPENGTLTLHTRNVDNDWIEVVVEDNGMGMPKEVLEKAMEPFFTTKGVGKGTGLGLSMVFSTVKAHRGQMAIESEPGQGTRVMLRFPACEQEAPVQAAVLAATEATPIPLGTMKVLHIDDDDLIQSSVQAILEVLGHTAVNTAQSGEEALNMLESGLEVDLVILDMNMPGLGGIGTLPRLRALRPEVPVLLATGRVDQTALTLASAHPGVTLLSKPFGLRELQKHLESIGLG